MMKYRIEAKGLRRTVTALIEDDLTDAVTGLAGTSEQVVVVREKDVKTVDVRFSLESVQMRGLMVFQVDKRSDLAFIEAVIAAGTHLVRFYGKTAGKQAGMKNE